MMLLAMGSTVAHVKRGWARWGIRSFRCRDKGALFEGKPLAARFGTLQASFARLYASSSPLMPLEDSTISRSRQARLEPLRGDRPGKHGIRSTPSWRAGRRSPARAPSIPRSLHRDRWRRRSTQWLPTPSIGLTATCGSALIVVRLNW